MRYFLFCFLYIIFTASEIQAKYAINYSAGGYNASSTSNAYGAGNAFKPNSIRNSVGRYGSFSAAQSVHNPVATKTPQLIHENGYAGGELSSNQYDPDSVSNQYGRYGNTYSPESINNAYGAGNAYRPDSPNNPYGRGLEIKIQD